MNQPTLWVVVVLGVLVGGCGGSSVGGDTLPDQARLDVDDVLDTLLDVPPSEVAFETRACTLDADCTGWGATGPCQVARCSPVAQVCEVAPLADHTLCDDGDPCTAGEACLAAECIGGVELDCDDDDPCTDDSCAPDAGASRCVHTPATGAPCDDGNLCTTTDVCSAGQCLGNDAGCACAVDADCRRFEDANACNGSLTCSDGTCTVDPATVISCDTSFDPPCVHTACEPQSGLCKGVVAVEEEGCDDGNPCTTDDRCQAGRCVAGEYHCEPCTADAECAPFDDADLCNGAVRCLEGQCLIAVGSVPSCVTTDDTQCRATVCVPATGGCQALQKDDGLACSDGDLCSAGDRCRDGSCVAAGAVACDDGNGCTDDTCDPAAGCVFTSAPSACDDGDPCTVDACDPAAGCSNTPDPDCIVCATASDCHDDDPCTIDSCVDSTCSYAIVDGLACDDGDDCTSGDQCVGGACQPGSTSLCDGQSCHATVELACEQHVAHDLGSAGTSDQVEQYACTAFEFDGPERVYHFVPAVNGAVTFTLNDAPNLFVLLLTDDGDGCDSSSCVSAHNHEVTWVVEAGRDYYVVVDGYAGSTEPYALGVDCSWTSPEACADGADNDLDGLTDCDDPDCALSVACHEYACADGTDDDDDGVTDCDDADCFFDPACTGGWSGESCDESFVFNAGEPYDGAWLGQAITRRFTTAGAVDDQHGSCQGAASGPDVAWMFSLSEPMLTTLSVAFDDGSPAALYVYAAPLCVDDYELACVAATDGAASLTRSFPAGTYFVIVDDPTGQGGPFELSLAFSEPLTHEPDCANGVDDDNDGVTDCADVDDCAQVNLCKASDACLAAASLGCGDSATGALAGEAAATSVVAQYACPDETQFGYWGNEYTFDYVPACDGFATATLHVLEPADALIDLFLLDGATGCTSSACLAYANVRDGLAVLTFPVTATTPYFLVADGYLGAAATFDLAVECTCSEVCDNQVDDDLDGLTDCADDADCEGTPACPSSFELDCANGYDEDQDGDTDCDDSDCAANLACPENDCVDGVDDDLDGLTDCADSDCASALICASPTACVPAGQLACNVPVAVTTRGAAVTSAVRFWTGCDAYGLDYSGAEVARSFVSPCTGEVEVRLVDLAVSPAGNLDVFVLEPQAGCNGAACRQALYGPGAGLPTLGRIAVTTGQALDLVVDGWQGYASDAELVVDCLCQVETCDDGVDNNGDGATDCADADCATWPTCPETDCTDGHDNDGDGATDCADAPCAATPACPETSCADKQDENHDGATDCADTTCFSSPYCTGGFSGETCGEPFVLNKGLHLLLSDAGYAETRWNTVSGASADLESLVTCGAWTTGGHDLVYRFALGANLVVTADLSFPSGIAGGLVLFSGAHGCVGSAAQEFAIGCAPATGGVARLERSLAPGTYYLVVEGLPTGADDGGYRLDVAFDAPPHETHCDDGVDDDDDGLTDCADAVDCGATFVCLHPLACTPAVGVDCGSSVQADLASNDVTNAVSSYACAAGSGAAYHGPEVTWLYTAGCTGAVTTTLTHTGDASGVYFDLFVLDAAEACDGLACVAMGVFDDKTHRATVTFPTHLGDLFYLVADGFDGALGPLSLDVSCACDEVCDDQIDNDLDGAIDCADPDCAGAPGCP